MIQILVVEDEAAVRENIVEFLQAEGYATLEARDGEEGVIAVMDRMPDLILCDIRMPRLDGFGMLAQISQYPAAANIPFVFLTARTERADQRLGMSMGADDYITKPFTRHDLLTSVRRRLDKHKSLTDLAERRIDELRAKITRGMPYELLAPAGILLGYSESLIKADWIASDPSQVRGMAREMNRAASRLIQMLQKFLLYLELDAATSDPIRREQQNLQITENCADLVTALAQGVAKSFGREADMTIEVQQVRLRVPDSLFQTLVEEFADRALRHSMPGTPIVIRGRVNPDGYYQLTFTATGSRLPPEKLPSSPMGFEVEKSPVGLLLAERIVSLIGGRLQIDGDIAQNQVELELPVADSR